MLSVTYTTLDFHIFQLLFRIISRFLLLFAILLPRDTRPEYDILAHTRRIKRGASGVSLFVAKFRPGFPLSYSGVDLFCLDCRADAAGGFDALAFVVEAIGNYGFGAVFVRGNSLRW